MFADGYVAEGGEDEEETTALGVVLREEVHDVYGVADCVCCCWVGCKS